MNSAAKRLLCLVNSSSGRKNGGEIAKKLQTLSFSSIDKIELRFLDNLDSLPAAITIEEEYSLVLIAGGDGTFSSVLGHYSDSNIEFVLLPLGTGNDLARELGIKKIWRGNLEKFLRQSFTLPAQPVQIWQATFTFNNESETKKFSNYISFGWDGVVVKQFEQWRNNGAILSGKFGPWGNRALYLLAGLSQPFYKLAPWIVESETGETQKGSKQHSLIFSNICSYMGLGKSNFTSNCRDKLIEFSKVNSFFNYLRMFLPKSFRGDNPIQCRSFTLKFDRSSIPVPVQIDGEYYDRFSGGSVEIRPAGRVLVRFPDF